MRKRIKSRYFIPFVVFGAVLAWTALAPAAVHAAPSWTQLQAANNWMTAAISGDGQYALTGVDGGRLYLVHDGNTVTETRPAGNANGNWYTTAISQNGNRMLAGSAFRLYI